MIDVGVLVNALVGQGIALSFAIAWLNAKGKRVEQIATDIAEIKEKTNKTDARGTPLLYGKDDEMLHVMEKLADINSRQIELLAEIRSEQREIRNDVAVHMCPMTGKDKK